MRVYYYQIPYLSIKSIVIEVYLLVLTSTNSCFYLALNSPLNITLKSTIAIKFGICGLFFDLI